MWFYWEVPYFDIFDDLINIFAHHGFTNYQFDHSSVFKYLKFSSSYKLKLEALGPQVLTMDHLEIAFIFSLCPLILSFVAFFGELLTFWLQKRRERRQEEKEYKKSFRKALKLNRKLSKASMKHEKELEYSVKIN